MDVKPKGIIKRVFDFAVAELERRSRPPPDHSGDDQRASEMDGQDPDDETTERIPAHSVEAQVAARQRALGTGAPAREREDREPKSVRPILGGLHLARGERNALKVRWAVAPEELQRSALLMEEGAVLCLRLVSFVAARDHVLREVQDRPSIQSQGECEIVRPDGRAVVSLGLRAGGRFVSIAHHVV